MISEAIKKVGLDDKSYNAMMNELEREKQLLKPEAVHNKITAEAKIREIDEQLSRLLDLFVEGAISADEYKEKKASLINKKTHHIENPVSGTSDGKWLELMRDFLTLAHQASYVASAGTPEELADFFKKICSNRKVANTTIYVSCSCAFKILAETEKEQLGSLSYFTRGNLSVFISLIICAISQYIKNILALERIFLARRCPPFVARHLLLQASVEGSVLSSLSWLEIT